ncbi:MAG: hypothetical protein ACRYF5_07415 [Janthinobacterium lividum]
MKIELVEDWKRARKWLSVQIPVAGAALLASYGALPDEWKSAIPHCAVTATAITFLIGGAVGRVISQPVLEPKDAP